MGNVISNLFLFPSSSRVWADAAQVKEVLHRFGARKIASVASHEKEKEAKKPEVSSHSEKGLSKLFEQI
ncbi:MAG: hypothetical protein NZ653_08900 [Anaerolineae bacterium]|nr:hypothetical protein [Anaerolineae bacterium]